MKILLYGLNYTPELTGIGKYTGEMVEWLSQNGHECRVICAPPYYPEWRVRSDYAGWKYAREKSVNVTVWRCPLWVPRSPSAFKRILHLLSFALSSFPVLLLQVFWRPDVVFVVEPPLFCAPQAWLTARLAGAKAWLHIQDFEVSAFFGLGFASPGPFSRLVIALEAWLMRRFDHVSTISQAMVNRLTKLEIPNACISLFPNWVDTQRICPGMRGDDLRTAWGFSSVHKVILYAGNLGMKQGLDMVLDVAVAMQESHPEARFLFVGEGAAKAVLVEKASRLKLWNTTFKPLQSLEALPAMLAAADIHLVIQRRGAADAVMPSKLGGILAAGGYTVITAGCDTELGKLVEDNPGIARRIEPENSAELLKVLNDMFDDSRSRKSSNQIARDYAERYLGREAVLAAFESDLSLLIRVKDDRQ